MPFSLTSCFSNGTKRLLCRLSAQVEDKVYAEERIMRAMLMALGAATILVGLSGQGIADEPAVLNCRLMDANTPWLFRQHCKSENFARHAYKRDIYKKKHALLEKKNYLKERLYWKIHYLEKKLYAELRECKTYKCKLIVKSKLAKLYSAPAYRGMSPSGFASNTLGTTSTALSATSNSLGGALNNTVSGTTNTIGGVTQSAGGVVSGATNTVGGAAQSAGGVVSGATNTVGGAAQSAGGVVSGATNTVGGLLK
jgi:hypothetical protein